MHQMIISSKKTKKFLKIMHIKGIEKLREKLPGYPGKEIIFLMMFPIFSFLIGLGFLVFFLMLPRIYPDIPLLITIEPILPILGALIIGITALLLVFTVWNKRIKYKIKFKEKAYQKVIRYGFSGIALLFAYIVYAYIPIELLPIGPPVNEITTLFSTSLLSFIPLFNTIEPIFRLIGSLVFVIIGLLMIRRSFLTFGIDYMAVVYLYYPEESELQNHEIYSILRHPTYSAALTLSIGTIFARFSLYSISFSVIFAIGLLIHIRLVEEKELIERFGDSYIKYRKKVPAFVVRPKNLGKFFKFLFKHEK